MKKSYIMRVFLDLQVLMGVNVNIFKFRFSQVGQTAKKLPKMAKSHINVFFSFYIRQEVLIQYTGLHGIIDQGTKLGIWSIGPNCRKIAKNGQFIFTPVSMVLCALGSQNLVRYTHYTCYFTVQFGQVDQTAQNCKKWLNNI